MTILIWGAGAIGGTIGAYLQRAGHDLLFVDIAAEHVEAMNQDGLEISGPIAEFTVPARAVTPPQLSKLGRKFKICLLCTKAQHTQTATAALAPWLADDGFVVSVQNGLNELIIQDIIGRERTVGAFINFSADYHAPGKILYGGRGAVVIGELDGTMSARLDRLQTLFRHFDPEAHSTDNIWGYLWGKEAYGAMLFLTALTHESIADALADPNYRGLYIKAAQEILQLAERLGVQARGFNGFEPRHFIAGDRARIHASIDALVAFNRPSAKTHSGIWRDLAVRKRKTEVVMYDIILAEGERARLDMRFTSRWIEMIHEIEDGKRPQSLNNLQELKAAFL